MITGGSGRTLLSKRVLDVTLGTLLALCVTPLIIVLAIGSAVALRSWPFFGQLRVGKDGRRMRILKVRTLPPGTPANADKYEIASQIDVNRYCRILRRLHLDELPQLWLVPTGRMSLVGPRPETPLLHEAFDPGFAALRTSVRPGCSGLWQVGEGAARLIGESPEYDVAYVHNAGVRLDLWVLWRTVGTMLGVMAPSSLDEVPEWTLRREPVPAGHLVSLPADQG